MGTVHYMPEGYHTITPYLMVENSASLIEFLKEVFDAEEVIRVPGEGGRIRHASVKIGDSRLEMADGSADWPLMPGSLHIYVSNVDAVYMRALHAGAQVFMEPQDQFYGERSASVRDPQGNLWHIATQIEVVSQEESLRRAAAHEHQKS